MNAPRGAAPKNDPVSRALAAHGELVTALYGGELDERGSLRLLYNRFLDEPEWTHAGRIATDAAAWPGELVRIRDFFHRRQRPAAVVIDRETSPGDLAERLAADGWHEAFRHRGLLFPTQGLVPKIEWPANATVEELASSGVLEPEAEAGEEPIELVPYVEELPIEAPRKLPSMDSFLAVFEAAFAETAPGYSFRGYRRAIPAGFERPRDGVAVAHTLVSIDGEPAAVGSRVLAGGVAGLYNLGVAPRFRARGLGGAVTAHRVAEARAAGAEVIFLLTEDPKVEAAQRKRGFEPGFELVGWVEPGPGR